MDYDYALAFALATKTLSIFAGAGLSKHLSGGAMPNWRELLETACASLSRSAEARRQLAAAQKAYPLEDCAQILELAFLREDKDLRKALAEIISAVRADPASTGEVKAFFATHPYVPLLTTNYDTLVEDDVLPARCTVSYPGKPAAHGDGRVNIVHVHGCTRNPNGMVVTANDYYAFVSSPGYFAQKISTTMHETSMLIIGYSLSDPNLKLMLNRFRSQDMRAINRGNLFFVTHGTLPTYVRDYYETAYGLVAIESVDIDALLRRIGARYPEAERMVKSAARDLRSVLARKSKWNDSYLKLNDSLFHIIATANSIGVDIHSRQFRRMLEAVLSRKVEFTTETGAWEQYSHLAEWLVYLGSVMSLPRFRGHQRRVRYGVDDGKGKAAEACAPELQRRVQGGSRAPGDR